jgi:hypothetical protein
MLTIIKASLLGSALMLLESCTGYLTNYQTPCVENHVCECVRSCHGTLPAKRESASTLYVEIKSIVRGDGAPADETSFRSRSET